MLDALGIITSSMHYSEILFATRLFKMFDLYNIQKQVVKTMSSQGLQVKMFQNILDKERLH